MSGISRLPLGTIFLRCFFLAVVSCSGDLIPLPLCSLFCRTLMVVSAVLCRFGLFLHWEHCPGSSGIGNTDLIMTLLIVDTLVT